MLLQEFFYGHGQYSSETHEALLAACGDFSADPFFTATATTQIYTIAYTLSLRGALHLAQLQCWRRSIVPEHKHLCTDL
eukprot:COSAG02_NODE_19596_length_874_cov_0.714839_2_plen_79_part_00